MLLLERPTSVAETVGMGGKAGEWGAFLLLKSFHINRVWVPPFLSFVDPPKMRRVEESPRCISSLLSSPLISETGIQRPQE